MRRLLRLTTLLTMQERSPYTTGACALTAALLSRRAAKLVESLFQGRLGGAGRSKVSPA